jgi:hypothetical protein
MYSQPIPSFISRSLYFKILECSIDLGKSIDLKIHDRYCNALDVVLRHTGTGRHFPNSLREYIKFLVPTTELTDLNTVHHFFFLMVLGFELHTPHLLGSALPLKLCLQPQSLSLLLRTMKFDPSGCMVCNLE